MPQGSFQSLFDISVSSKLIGYLNSVFPAVPSTHVAGLPGTQAQDIVHSVGLALEQGQDLNGACGVAQADIRTFYDKLPMLPLALFLVSVGVPASFVAVCLRVQLVPVIQLSVLGVAFCIKNRTKGGITGTRLAGALGRIPIYELIRSREPSWRMLGFKIHDGVLTMPTYIDNLYAIAGSVENAIAIMSDAEQHLQAKWALSLKADSKLVTSSATGAELSDGQWIEGYKYVANFPVLGRLVNHGGSLAVPFAETVKRMWGGFWGNAGSARAKLLPERHRCLLIDRAVRPHFEFQCASWPAQKQYGDKLDALQRKMHAIALGFKRLPCESPQQFNSRRSRAIGTHVRQRWSLVWYRQCDKWAKHLSRHPEFWPARLLAFRDAAWLQARRLVVGSLSVLAGRTATRAHRAHVERRWQDGLDFARAQL